MSSMSSTMIKVMPDQQIANHLAGIKRAVLCGFLPEQINNSLSSEELTEIICYQIRQEAQNALAQ